MHIKTIASVLLFPIAAFLLSCNSGDGHQQATTNTKTDSTAAAPPPAYDNTLAIGRKIDTVLCKSDNTQSYALYLPSSYTTARAYPCICFFDSHGSGSLPLNMYKALAERYGFIMVGSNSSKNGTSWDIHHDVVKKLLADINSRLHIDPRRIYTSGFSGGSRVAVTTAVADGGIAGVIGCAAGFPQIETGLQNKIDYFGIVGDQDFNMAEMIEWDAALAQNGCTHQLLTSGGIHGWATAADFSTALLWLQVTGMRENLEPKNDTLITALQKDYEKRIADAKAAKDRINTYTLTDGEVRTLDGLKDMTAEKKQLADLQAGNDLKQALSLQKQLQQTENARQHDMVREYAQHDEKWLTAQVAEFNKSAHSAKTQQEAQMDHRLLNYFGLVSYMNANRALDGNDLANAATYIKVFRLTDNKNPDGAYLSAIYYTKEGDTKQAITALNEAATLGYNDVAQLISELAFQNIKSDVGYQKVLSRVVANYTSNSK